MGKIGIHFENKIVIMLQRPFKTGYIGCAETEFSGTFYYKEFPRIHGNHGFHDCGGIVGGIVIDNEDMELLREAIYNGKEVLYIFGFPVSWDYY